MSTLPGAFVALSATIPPADPAVLALRSKTQISEDEQVRPVYINLKVYERIFARENIDEDSAPDANCLTSE
ncbi:hypothetical protein [Bradyrhizobium sp. LTSPM299]|uniref:hypothetical protein n=1 Tax=Bradyrhizobium sp. LTSPM299 TaxID=1619233 RepID=UPI0012E154EE|nr:hypothetical protein [Bradyrhizobium sp. LTSPM299]